MKKTIASLAFAGAGLTAAFGQTGSGLGDLSITGTFAFESEYVYRGIDLQGDHNFQPSVEFGFPVLGGDLYTGVWAMEPIGTRNAPGQNEIDFYFGLAYPVTDMFTLDVGFTYYWYPQAATGDAGQTREIYFGASADVIASPALYFYYDFDLEQTVLELSVGYSFDLGEHVGANGLSFDIGAYIGWLTANNINGGAPGPKAKNGYIYGGLTGDLVYMFNEYVSSSIGVRYAFNNDGNSAVNGGRENNIWFGASLGFAY